MKTTTKIKKVAKKYNFKKIIAIIGLVLIVSSFILPYINL